MEGRIESELAPVLLLPRWPSVTMNSVAWPSFLETWRFLPHLSQHVTPQLTRAKGKSNRSICRAHFTQFLVTSLSGLVYGHSFLRDEILLAFHAYNYCSLLALFGGLLYSGRPGLRLFDRIKMASHVRPSNQFKRYSNIKVNMLEYLNMEQHWYST